MPSEPIPIATGQHSNVDERSLRDRNAQVTNFMLDDGGGLVSRPGLSTFATFFPENGQTASTAYVELLFPYRSWIVAVLNDGRVFQCESDGTTTDITGDRVRGPVLPTATIDQNGDLLITRGGMPVRWKGYGTTKDLTTGFAPKATHLAVVQGYLVGNDYGADNDDIYYTSIEDHAAWDVTRVFQAESRRDPCIALMAAQNFLFLFGESSIDVYYPTNSASPAFARAYTIPRGVASPRAVVQVDGQVFFMDTNRRICRLNDRTPEVISLEIERPLLALQDVSDCVVHRVDFEGRHLLAWHFASARIAYVYDYAMSGAGKSLWYEWRGWSSSDWASMPLSAYAYQPEWRRHFCAGSQSLRELDGDAGIDVTDEIRRVVRSGFVNRGTGKAKRSSVLRTRCTRGNTVSTTDSPEMLVRFRDEDMEWQPYAQLSLGLQGKQNVIGAELRGLGIYRERQWELASTANVSRLAIYQPEEEFEVLMR